MINSIREIMATREFNIGTAEQHKVVTVIIGKPMAFDDGSGFYCPFQILGLGSDKAKYAAGIDGVQALQLAMAMIGADLRSIDKKIDGHLHWQGGEDLGFP